MSGKTHLTSVNAKTVLSAKGQVVIPKEVREALGLSPGQVLDVVRTRNGLLLTPAHRKSGRSTKEILNRIHAVAPPYEGPLVTDETMHEAIDKMFRDTWKG